VTEVGSSGVTRDHRSVTDELLLSDFNPRSELLLPGLSPVRPGFSVIDAHSHLGDEFGGGWHRRSATELVDELDASGIEVLVDLDGGWGEDILDSRLARFKDPYPDRFMCFGGVSWDHWPEIGTRFPEWAAARLKAQVMRGAQGLKIWKPFGLRVVDERGERVAVDDVRLDCLWATACELKVPVTIHVGDPAAFFRPVDGSNERYLELVEHPDWHFGRPPFPDMPTIMSEFASLVLRHPATTFIGAHVGCFSENLAWVSALLDSAPNFYVDIADRLDELSRQPFTTRAFFGSHSERILFGADRPVSPEMYEMYFRFLQTRDENFVGPGGDQPGRSWRLTGLGLDSDVLRRVYGENARRVLSIA
jgi:predicted TIM-barrel fold metal-dependent hydrolase